MRQSNLNVVDKKSNLLMQNGFVDNLSHMTLNNMSGIELEQLMIEHMQQLQLSIKKYDIVLIRNDQSVATVVAMISILKLQANILLVSHQISTFEENQLIMEVGVNKKLSSEGDGCCVVETHQVLKQRIQKCFLIPTSGSTGKPKIIYRSEQSLLSEARRYQKFFEFKNNDHVLIPLPINHAYALGVLIACLQAGVSVTICKPTQLSRIEHLLQSQVSICILSVAIARLLATRSAHEPYSSSWHKLRCVLVGAGPVDQSLDDLFYRKFQIRLSRNYGSTESGAIASGFAPLPSYCVGSFMADVEYRIDSHFEEATRGRLFVKTPCSSWIDMGDIVELDDNGQLTILGRVTHAIRRGDRWISPIEIESTLRQYPEIRDVHVTSECGSYPGDERIIAYIVIKRPQLDRVAFDQFIETTLGYEKRPNHIRIVDQLNRDNNGKILFDCSEHYAINQAQILQAVRSYRQSELIFALHSKGILRLLAADKTCQDIAQDLNIDREALQNLLALAERYGVISKLNKKKPINFVSDPYIDYECSLSTTINSRHHLLAMMQEQNASINTLPCVDDAMRRLYRQAMHGKQLNYKVLKGLRRLEITSSDKICEITSCDANYTSMIQKKYPDSHTTVIFFGQLVDKRHCINTFKPKSALYFDVFPESAQFDKIILNNAIHNHLEYSSNLTFLEKRLNHHGIILIDDIFIDDSAASTDMIFDWTTHKKLNNLDLSDLIRQAKALFKTVEYEVVFKNPNNVQIFLKKGE